MNVEQLQTYAKEVCFIEDKEQFHAMLNFYHDVGMIVKHRSTVILKAQWLIELFKMLITIPPFNKAVQKRYAWNFKAYLQCKALIVFFKPLVIFFLDLHIFLLRTALKCGLVLSVKGRALVA